MSKIFLFLFLLLATRIHATVKPELADLAARSDWVVTAQVIQVEGTGDEPRIVTFQANDVIKGTFPTYKKPPTLRVERHGKGDIDFTELVGQPDSIFFLVGDSATGYRLTDDWFGVEPLTDENLERVKAAVQSP